MATDTNNNSGGGLSDSNIGHMGTRTRIKSMSSPEFNKLRGELKASSPEGGAKSATLKEILDRLDESTEGET